MNIIKKILPYKYKRSVKEMLGVPSLHWSLQNLKKKNFSPGLIIDIGAYEGLWTIDFLEVFPSARVLMVEAQKSKEIFLKRIRQKYPNTDYAISLLSSANETEKHFYENATASHISNVPDKDSFYQIIKTQTLDSLLEEKQFPLPDFLKLDVQGHELEVLKGASKALLHAQICLLEVTLIDLGDQNPLLFHMIHFMDEKGFQAYDICQFMRRPFDKTLYQMDVLFVKKDSPVIGEKRWN